MKGIVLQHKLETTWGIKYLYVNIIVWKIRTNEMIITRKLTLAIFK